MPDESIITFALTTTDCKTAEMGKISFRVIVSGDMKIPKQQIVNMINNIVDSLEEGGSDGEKGII